MSPSRLLPRTVSVGLMTLLMTGVLAGPALAASTGELEACFLSRINAARASAGVQALTLNQPLTEYGRSHSRRMADAGSLFHSSSADLAPYLPAAWRSWGENVGVGGGTESCDRLFQAFWDSPGHRANLLNPDFNLAGIGVYIDGGGTLWTTHVFVETSDPAPSPTTTTTAPPATTTTTAPPATTTTTAPPATTTTTAPAATTTTTAPAATTTTAPALPATTTSAPGVPGAGAPAQTSTVPARDPKALQPSAESATATAAASPKEAAGSTSAAGPGVAAQTGAESVDRVAEDAAAGLVERDPSCSGCDQKFLVAILGLVVTGGVIATWSFRH